MRPLVAIVVGVALIAELALFLGVGFGSGALNTGGSGVSSGYSQSPANAGSGWGDGLSWQVDMSQAASGSPITTAALPGYQSTGETFYLQAYSKGDCGNTGRPTWFPGIGADYGYFVVQYKVGGSPASWSGMIDGSPVSSPASGFAVTANSSSSAGIWCGVNSGGADSFTSGIGQPSYTFPNSQHTVSVTGLIQSGQLVVSFYLFYTYCDGTGVANGQGGTACDAGHNAGGAGGNILTPNGGRSLSASTSVNAYSAGASVQVNNGATLYNGRTLSITAYTGYDGPNGYQLEVQCPQPRPCGGSADPAFQQFTVPNQVTSGKTYTWSIPSNYAVNSSTQGWNTVTVELIANYGVAAQTLAYPVSISPLFQPSAPVITWSSSGSGGLYPSVGDTVTFTIYANASGHSQNVSSVGLAVFYLQSGQSVTSPPPCGAAWVTSQCPATQAITLRNAQTQHATGSFSFTVQPPLQTVAIGALAISETSTQQGNVSNPVFINLKTAGCQPGQTCDPLTASLNFWQTAGPVLLAAMLVTGSVLLAMIIPTRAWGRYLVVAGGVGVVILLYLVGFVQWFAPGGVL